MHEEAPAPALVETPHKWTAAIVDLLADAKSKERVIESLRAELCKERQKVQREEARREEAGEEKRKSRVSALRKLAFRPSPVKQKREKEGTD